MVPYRQKVHAENTTMVHVNGTSAPSIEWRGASDTLLVRYIHRLLHLPISLYGSVNEGTQVRVFTRREIGQGP
jgi:hypothetical protein